MALSFFAVSCGESFESAMERIEDHDLTDVEGDSKVYQAIARIGDTEQRKTAEKAFKRKLESRVVGCGCCKSCKKVYLLAYDVRHDWGTSGQCAADARECNCGCRRIDQGANTGDMDKKHIRSYKDVEDSDGL